MGNCKEQSIGKGHWKLKESINLRNLVLPRGPESKGVINRDPVMSSG